MRVADQLVCSIVPIEAVVRLAQRVPVFPCRRNSELVESNGRSRLLKPKSPLTQRGFLDASQDPEQIRAWWRQHPEALVGVPTGRTTGLLVIDVDTPKLDDSARQWLAVHQDWLTQTRAHTTLSGGRHYLYRLPPGQTFSSGVNITLDGAPRRGIDMRGEGGYIVWWPAHGAVSTGEVAPLPAGLADERRIVKRDLPPLPAASPHKWQRDRSQVADALAYLEPADYAQWRNVGMAIHLASGGSDDGFALWHAWSAGEVTGETPASYSGIEDCRYHWSSYRHDKGRKDTVTLGSVFAAAKTAGWAPKRDAAPPQAEEPPDMESPPPDAESEPDTDCATPPKFALRWLSDVLANPTAPRWLIRDTLEEAVIAVMAGPRGTFKSFIALHWAMTVACAGFEVVVVSAEGAGIDRRIKAWLQRNAPDRDPKELKMAVLERRVNFNDDADTVELIAAVETLGIKPALVTIDTVSKNSGGLDENENSEVKVFIGRIDDGIKRRWGATVLLVHHTGHAEQGRARGASAWEADTDAAYVVKREAGTRLVTVSRERFKDSADLPPLVYEAAILEIGGMDEWGLPITSIALVPANEEAVSTRRAGQEPRGGGQRQLLNALKAAQREAQGPLIWTQGDIRKIGRAAGLSKDTAYSAAAGLCQFWLRACVGGYRLPTASEKD